MVMLEALAVHEEEHSVSELHGTSVAWLKTLLYSPSLPLDTQVKSLPATCVSTTNTFGRDRRVLGDGVEACPSMDKYIHKRRDMEDTSFPWNKITLNEALFLDETTLTHCLYAIHDQVNWLYIGQSRRLVTRLYQHLGIATGRESASASGERLLDPDEALNLLNHDYIPPDPRDFFWYLDEQCAVYDGTSIQDL